MKDFEYRELLQKGKANFNNIDHNANLNKLIDSNLDSIMNFPKRTSEEIKSYQLQKLSELVDYAYTNIPLYRKKYNAIGYKLKSIKSFEDFEKLPILYKDELIEGFPDSIVKSEDDFKYSTRSSGSSGRFVTIALTLDAIYEDTLQGIRQFHLQSESKYSKRDQVLYIYTDPWWTHCIDKKYMLHFLPTTTEPIKALEFIKETCPLIISTYPTYLQKFCELNIRLCDYGVKYAIVHSEQSTRQARHDMAKMLGITVYDEYSSEELTRIALECKNFKYHLEEDSCYIEVLDFKTKKKIENGTGLVVGTNLLNKATPIIRYHQGDIVKIDYAQKCTCGHNGRIITEIQGREMDCIISNGKKIPASAFMDLAYNWFLKSKVPIQGLRYQIAQISENEICIHLIKGLYELTNIDLKNIRESLYSLVDRNMVINIEFSDKFIQKSAKFKPVINLMGENI